MSGRWHDVASTLHPALLSTSIQPVNIHGTCPSSQRTETHMDVERCNHVALAIHLNLLTRVREWRQCIDAQRAWRRRDHLDFKQACRGSDGGRCSRWSRLPRWGGRCVCGKGGERTKQPTAQNHGISIAAWLCSCCSCMQLAPPGIHYVHTWHTSLAALAFLWPRTPPPKAGAAAAAAARGAAGCCLWRHHKASLPLRTLPAACCGLCVKCCEAA